MKANEVRFFQNKYFKQHLNKMIDDQLVLDHETHRETIEFFNFILMKEQENGGLNYSDEELLTTILFDVFPHHFVLQPDFSTEIYAALMLYYEFLYQEKQLTTVEYTTILLFFQRNLFKFLKRMAQEADEEGSFSDFNEQFLEELTELVGDIDISIDKQPQRNNVIQMPTRLRSVSPKPPFSPTEFVQLRVDLDGFKPPIWRRVIVPFGITYGKLNEIIQALFEWENRHLHLFTVGNRSVSNLAGDDFEDSDTLIFENSINASASFSYIYDFGDAWEHTLQVEKIFSEGTLPDEGWPHCLKKVGAAPTEDSRGTDERQETSLKKINQRLSTIKF